METLKADSWKIDCGLPVRDEIWEQLKKDIKNANGHRNQFIESAITRYMLIKDLRSGDMKVHGLHLRGPDWDEYRYKDDLIVRVETDLNWDEGSVGYRCSVNEALE